MQTQKSRFQKKMHRLTQRRLFLVLALQHIRNVIFWLLALLFMIAALILVIASWRMGFGKELSLLIMCIIFIPMISVILIEEILKSDGQKHSLFQKYGAADILTERLQEGGEHILLETKTIVLTESYIIDQRNYENYIPYGKLAAFEIDDGLVHKMLFGSSDVYLNMLDAAGDRFNCVIRPKDLCHKSTIVTLIKKQAPHAKYGIPLPEKTQKRQKE